jgi:uncharacterized membrane protein YdjX (TVP38/TMEM64 family)
MGLSVLFIGMPMLRLVEQPEVFRDWIASKGWGGRFIFIGMVAIQVIFAIIPGEPLEIGAGYAFGAIEGTLLCLAGFLLGSLIIFAFVKKWGVKFIELFFPVEKINNLRFLNTNKKLNALAFILFLIPGTPKDLMVYFLGVTNITFPAFLVTVTLARLPSLVTSTVGGNALGTQNYVLAIVIFAVAVVISCVGYFLYQFITKQKSKKS